MANFNTVSDWSTTPATNTSVATVSVAENCPMANINNAIRSVMAGTKGALTSVATTGTDTYTATLAPAPDAYATEQLYLVKFAITNTSTTPTINLNALGAKTITRGDGTAVSAGDLLGEHILVYDGTNMRVLNPKLAVTTGTSGHTIPFLDGVNTWSAAQTFSATETLSAALNEAKGADIASATTTDIGAATGNYVNVTGTTTITGLGTVQAGTRRIVNFNGALLLTYNATSLILPTSQNITTAAGDTATFVSLGSGNWVCVNYQRKSGAPLASSTGTLTAGTQIVMNPYTVSTHPAGTAHGLGGHPAFIRTYLECLTIDGGYAVGDRISVEGSYWSDPDVAGFTVSSDTTNIYISTGINPPAAANKGSNAFFVLTVANWKIVATPYKLN